MDSIIKKIDTILSYPKRFNRIKVFDIRCDLGWIYLIDAINRDFQNNNGEYFIIGSDWVERLKEKK